jgi:site-specific recombinase XerD
MHLDDALSRFLTQLEADGRSPHTIGQYRRHVRALGTWLPPGREIEAVGHEDLARFLAAPVAKTRPDGASKKATSVNALRSSLKGFWGYVHRAGYVAADPSRLIRRAITGPPPPKTLSEDDQRRLLDALSKAEDDAGKRDHALFHLMLATGIRIGSALALDVEDVDLERGEIVLRKMKGDRQERIYLGREIREHLRRFIAGRATGPVFTAWGRRRLSARHVQRRFGEWLREAGIMRAASPHSCRHAFAMAVYARTRDILIVKEALRHRSLTSTMVYAKVCDEQVRRAVDA